MESFILLGDSLFQRAPSRDKDTTDRTIGSFQPRLADAYVRRLDIQNRGLSGYNTRQVLDLLRSKHLRSILPPSKGHKVRFVVVFLGANDARLPNTPGGPQQHVPLAKFRENLRDIVRRVRLHSKPKHVILVTPPPVDERMTVAADGKKDTALEGVIRRKAVVTAEYARVVRQLVQWRNARIPDDCVKVLDIWDKIIDLARKDKNASTSNNSTTKDESLESSYLDEHNQPLPASAPDTSTQSFDETTLPGSIAAPLNPTLRSYLIDGLHFSRKGYDLLYDELMALIAEHFPESLPENLPMAVPAWDDPGKLTFEMSLPDEEWVDSWTWSWLMMLFGACLTLLALTLSALFRLMWR